jgi:UV DNA damage endonuclease
MTNFGYACINTSLSSKSKSDHVTTNRSMIKKTFAQKGVAGASSLALLNVLDLEKIVQWNEQNGFKFFRISSDLFPWASEYEFEQMPDFDMISVCLARIGKFATDNGHRLTFHPGPFNKLSSPNDAVVKNTIKDLEIHGRIFDLMGLSRTPYNKINIHLGAHYNDKPKAVSTFCKNFDLLSDSVKSRLTIENDDHASLYSVGDLYSGVHKSIGIPIVFDYHHWRFNNNGLSIRASLDMAEATWRGVKPVVHYSESRSEEQGIDCKPQAHSDFVVGPIDLYGVDVDVMIEAKQKEMAVKRHLQQSQNI